MQVSPGHSLACRKCLINSTAPELSAKRDLASDVKLGTARALALRDAEKGRWETEAKEETGEVLGRMAGPGLRRELQPQWRLPGSSDRGEGKRVSVPALASPAHFGSLGAPSPSAPEGPPESGIALCTQAGVPERCSAAVQAPQAGGIYLVEAWSVWPLAQQLQGGFHIPLKSCPGASMRSM